MKVLVTGGHLTPALAVIEHLPKGTHVLYVGRKYALEGDKAYSLEYQTITGKKIPFTELVTGRLQRKFSRHTISSLLKTPAGFWRAIKIIRGFKPDVILGFGGYVSLPICFAGSMLRIPVVIHEQTLDAGFANKLLAPFAKKICISWEQSRQFFPKDKTILTGNPSVTSVFTLISQAEKRPAHSIPLPTILVVGGSLGSHALNLLVEKNLKELLSGYNVIHQTGDAKEFADYDRLELKKKTLAKPEQERYTIVKFINPDEIISFFKKADVVVSRAGINTVTTLLLLNKPALLIPLKLSKKSEQEKNALFFTQHGLGELAYQDELESLGNFTARIHAMIKQLDTYKNKINQSELTVHKKAPEAIIRILLSCARQTYQTERQNEE